MASFRFFANHPRFQFDSIRPIYLLSIYIQLLDVNARCHAMPCHLIIPHYDNPYESLHLSLSLVYLSPVNASTLIRLPSLLEK
jgi:hypothetical protein